MNEWVNRQRACNIDLLINDKSVSLFVFSVLVFVCSKKKEEQHTALRCAFVYNLFIMNVQKFICAVLWFKFELHLHGNLQLFKDVFVFHSLLIFCLFLVHFVVFSYC